MKKIALVEVMPQHSETIYSQIQFLTHSGYEVTLFCNKRIEAAIESFRGESKAYYYRSSRLSGLYNIKQDIVKGGFDKVILNTAQGSAAMKLIYMLPNSIKIFGTTHDTSKLYDRASQKLSKFLTQKLITRKIDGYYVLAEYIDKKFPINKPHSWFNPAFFPSYEDIDLQSIKGESIWITIPGNLEYKRRDYNFVIDLAANPMLNKNVRFVLLGNKKLAQGCEIVDKIKERNLEERFIWFDERVPERTFYAYIKHSDYFMPLLNSCYQSQAYAKSKISGMFPLSSAYRVDLLCEVEFESVENFNYPAKFYSDVASLIKILNSSDRDKSKDYKELIFQEEAARYCRLIEL